MEAWKEALRDDLRGRVTDKDGGGRGYRDGCYVQDDDWQVHEHDGRGWALASTSNDGDLSGSSETVQVTTGALDLLKKNNYDLKKIQIHNNNFITP